MKILHLATQDIGGGGGGFDAAYRLHCNMRVAGVESVMAVQNKQSNDSNVIDISKHLTALEWLSLGKAKLLARYKKYRYGCSKYFMTENENLFPVERLTGILPFKPDAIITHWIANFFTASMMRQLSVITGAPLYWYMMDMAPLTGGCHYAFDCKGYMRYCGHCPQIKYGSYEFDISFRQLEKKRSNFIGADITAVVASSWLKHQAKASTLFSERSVKQIMLGIDVNVYKPTPQVGARSVLGLPVDKKIVFFGTHYIYEKRKGISYLFEALKILYTMLDGNPGLRSNMLIVIAGSTEKTARLDIPFEQRYVGFLRGDVMLSTAYQAADIFVNASIEDSGPMMINESILCGTPVVSFDMGVAPDLVHTGRTGYRARLRDSNDMARGLFRLLTMDAESIHCMRIECRKLGVQLCHPEVQVRAFLELCAPRLVENTSLHER